VLPTILGVVAVLGIGGGLWILSLPTTPPAGEPPPIAEDDANATIAALKPPKRQRPVIAIIGANAGTEITDYLMPYGILRRADVADVLAVSTTTGPVTLYPAALKVIPQATVSDFDAKYPEGADYVIVPAMSRDDDPAVLEWIRSQASRGALIIGVCVGVTVVANTGLLDGKRATTHWYSVKGMRKKHPSIRYVPDRRIVVDQGVATTTGITASMPVSLMLIEAIAGRDKAEQVARDLGVVHWDARHRSDAFKFTRAFAVTAISNRLSFWRHEELSMEVPPGVDEVSLALVADAWSRTYRSRAVTFAGAPGAQRSRGGMGIVPDRIVTNGSAPMRLPALGDRPPAQALDHVLEEISARYGTRTAEFVAMQLEYPRAR
jgi:putative intracellular protease/amidase